MDLERREFVATGAAALGSALAGCSGDDDENGDDGETPDSNGDEEGPAQPLGIEHVRFAAEEPTDYREYEAVEEATYTAEEVVWIYYEPVGFATEDAGDGEARIDLSLELTVTGPTGERSDSFDEEIEREVLSDVDRDEQWLVWSYQPATSADPGEYTAEITMVDEITGEEITETVTFTIENEEAETGSGEELRIADALLIAGEPEGSGEYEPAEDSTYAAEEVVWIYYDPVGVTTEDTGDGEARVDIHHELTVTGPSGQESTFDNDIEQTVPPGSMADRGLWWNYQLPASADPGEYTAEITFVDELGDEEVTATVTFTVEGDGTGGENGDDGTGGESGDDGGDGELTIEHVRLIADQPTDYREYEEVEDGTYAAEEVVWIYYEPTGVATEDAGDGELRIDLTSELAVTPPGSQTPGLSENEVEQTIAAGAADTLYLWWTYQPPASPDPGEYTAEITIVDEIADAEATETVTFRIETE